MQLFDQFQSTPVIANGRIQGAKVTQAAHIKFQSTPVIANGRINVVIALDRVVVAVSIHARYC